MSSLTSVSTQEGMLRRIEEMSQSTWRSKDKASKFEARWATANTWLQSVLQDWALTDDNSGTKGLQTVFDKVSDALSEISEVLEDYAHDKDLTQGFEPSQNFVKTERKKMATAFNTFKGLARAKGASMPQLKGSLKDIIEKVGKSETRSDAAPTQNGENQ